jgi:hypothetical protein
MEETLEVVNMEEEEEEDYGRLVLVVLVDLEDLVVR